MTTPQRNTLVSYVPTARLAELLVAARGGMGISLDEICEVFAGRVTVFQLMQLEASVLTITDEDLRVIAKAYGLDYNLFAPARGLLRVDLANLTISMGESESAFEAVSSSTDVLIRYLALLYNLRLAKPGEPIVLRDPDLNELAATFACPPSQIEKVLRHLMINNIPDVKVQVKALTRRPSFLRRLLA